ncbi:ricin-type beta-trefoil lectin domain protein [Streptomyces sp. NPDC005236]|uniref:RICIN domain-containing protein n=1 Tax=Streptomyces sp. NPDC005236 TaxID=3157028 RepID=UPI0033A82050
MRINTARIAKVLGTAALVPALALTMTTAAQADGDVHWVHRDSGKALTVNWAHDHPDDVTLTWESDVWTQWHDVHQSDGSWLEKSSADTGYCLTAYTDHDAYMEPCSGNNWQRWDEIGVGGGNWKLRNRQTHECLDGNGSSVYMHECNDGNKYQLWY